MAAEDGAGKKLVAEGGPPDIQTAWRILAGGAPVAAAALVDIAENGKSELARVQASNAVLDRVGLATPKERPSVHFAVIPAEYGQAGIGAQQLSPAEVVRSRLKKLGAAMAGLPAVGGGDGSGEDGGEAAADGWAAWGGDGEDEDGTVEAELVPMEGEDGEGPW